MNLKSCKWCCVIVDIDSMIDISNPDNCKRFNQETRKNDILTDKELKAGYCETREYEDMRIYCPCCKKWVEVTE